MILWWNLDVRQVGYLEPPFWNSFKIFKGNKINSVWTITVGAILWTLWLSRNDLLFNNKKDSTSTLEGLVKTRSFYWGVAAKFLRNELHDLWRVNPVGAILLSIKKEAEEGIIWWNTDAIGYVDGSWKEELINGSRIIRARMGGYLTDAHKMVKYMFFGPTEAWCPLEAELRAVLHLYKAIKSSSHSKCRVFICVDSMTLVNKFEKESLGWNPIQGDSEWNDLVMDRSVKIKYLPREELQGADSLEKDGRDKAKLLSSWA